MSANPDARIEGWRRLFKEAGGEFVDSVEDEPRLAVVDEPKLWEFCKAVLDGGKAVVFAAREAKLLLALNEAAERGQRCPKLDALMRDGHEAVRSTMERLVKAGKVRVEIYAVNWRVVEIVATGQRTRESPHGGEPYLVMERRA